MLGSIPFIGSRIKTGGDLLFSWAAGVNPSGSLFERATIATADNDSTQNASWAASPRWHMIDGSAGFICLLSDSTGTGYQPTDVEDSWLSKLMRLLTPVPSWDYANLSVNGARLSSGTATLNINGLRASYVSSVNTAKKGIFLVNAMTNDAFLDGASAATCFTRLTDITSGLRTSHPLAKIYVGTPIPRQNNGGFETIRLAFRTTVLAGHASYDGVMDFGNPSNAWAVNAASSNDTNWFTDTIHGTNALYDQFAAIALTPVNAARTALAI